MYDKLADFEKEMFDLQKNHRRNIRELLEEADGKMNDLKQQHSDQVESIVSSIIRRSCLYDISLWD